MAQKMTLETIFTALTCLSASDYAFKPTYINSRIPVSANNFSIDCQLQAFDLLNIKLARMNQQISKLQRDVDNLKSMLRDLPSSEKRIPTSCEDQPTGVTQIKPLNQAINPFYVVCDQSAFGGDWLIFAQRFDGAVDFYRTWADYKIGFGNRELDSEFFLGLDNLHAITNAEIQELLVIMETKDQEVRTAHYSQFSIGNEFEKYKINLLGKYDGNAGDALRYHSGSKFSTYDQDNDKHPQSCAKLHTGAWWYADCMESNLFGTFQQFGKPDIPNFKGILWKGLLNGPKGSLKKIKMLVKPQRKQNNL